MCLNIKLSRFQPAGLFDKPSMGPPVLNSNQGVEVTAIEILVKNLNSLAQAHGLNQAEIARRAGIS